MQDLGLVAGTSEFSGISIPNVQYTQMPTSAQSSLSLHQGRWPWRTEPAGHSQLDTWASLDQDHTGNEHCHLWTEAGRQVWPTLLWMNPCLPWFQWGTEGCVSSSEASGLRCYRTNQSFLGLAVYALSSGDTPKFLILTDVIRFVWTSVVL